MAPRKRSAVRKVFLSSTARDLGPHREAVSQAIARLDGFHCIRMEDFGARDWEADGFCRARVAECDVFVGLIGHLFGSSPPGLEVSFTEREHEAAVASGLPRLLFLAAADLPLSPSLREPDDLWRRQLVIRDAQGKLVPEPTRSEPTASKRGCWSRAPLVASVPAPAPMGARR